MVVPDREKCAREEETGTALSIPEACGRGEVEHRRLRVAQSVQ